MDSSEVASNSTASRSADPRRLGSPTRWGQNLIDKSTQTAALADGRPTYAAQMHVVNLVVQHLTEKGVLEPDRSLRQWREIGS